VLGQVVSSSGTRNGEKGGGEQWRKRTALRRRRSDTETPREQTGPRRQGGAHARFEAPILECLLKSWAWGIPKSGKLKAQPRSWWGGAKKGEPHKMRHSIFCLPASEVKGEKIARGGQIEKEELKTATSNTFRATSPVIKHADHRTDWAEGGGNRCCKARGKRHRKDETSWPPCYLSKGDGESRAKRGRKRARRRS